MEKKVPITRIGKFFGQEDFDLDIEMGQEWLGGDMNFTLVLYKVDKLRTKNDDVYGEVGTDEIQFLPPIEFKAYVKIVEPTNAYMGNTRIVQTEPGNMTFSVYNKELDALNIDIDLGDYIGYYETETKVRYYSVVNDGKITSDLKHSYGGYKAFYKTYVCTPVSYNEFRGI